MYGGGENSNQTNYIGGSGSVVESNPPLQPQLRDEKVKKINNIINNKHKLLSENVKITTKYGSQALQSNKFLMIFPAFKVLFLIVFIVFFYRRIIDLVTFFDVSDIHADFYISWITLLLILWVILPANRSIVL